jgi:hypothetical protein
MSTDECSDEYSDQCCDERNDAYSEIERQLRVSELMSTEMSAVVITTSNTVSAVCS